MQHDSRSRSGATLIELLVVMSIMATLVGILVPAVQKAREAASSLKCRNNLKQMALAALNYHDAMERFPPGVADPDPNGRYTTLFVELLPYFEQNGIYTQWNFSNPGSNFGGPGTPAAATIPIMVCPSQAVTQNPIVFGTLALGVSTYGGNGGMVSFPSFEATNDGIFGYSSTTTNSQICITQVTDGTSNTFFFGERLVGDANMDSYLNAPITPDPDPPLEASGLAGGWASATGPNCGAGTLLSGQSMIDFTFPICWSPPVIPPPPLPPPPPPPPVQWSMLGPLVFSRVSAYGSAHIISANFALGDGSARVVSSSTSLTVLQALSTRGGGEVVENY